MSSPVAGYAVMPIVPSLRGLDAEINRQLNGPGKAAAKKAGTEAGKSYREAFSAVGIDSGSLTSFGVKAVAVGGIAALGLAKATKAAGDLNAAVSTSEQVFGSSATAIEEWSKGSADSIGLSQRAAIEAATSFATFGKSAGLSGSGLTDFSTDLTSLASDLAAFKNTKPEEALQALQSGLAGESEPLRRYGILLNEAQLKQEALRLGIIDTTTGALSPQQRVLAANELIFRQGADAIGQFTRESDELTTQGAKLSANWEDAQAALGESLLPALTDAAKGANSLLQSFQGLDEGTQGFIAKLALGGAGASVLVGGLSLAAGAAMKLQDAYGRMATAGANGNRVVGTTAKVAKGAGAALGAAGMALAVYQVGKALDEASKDAVGFETALNRITGAAAGANIDAYIADLAAAESSWSDTAGDIQNVIGNLGQGGPDSLQIGDYAVEFDELAAALERAKAAGANDELARIIERISAAEPPKFDSFFDSKNEADWLELQDQVAGYEEYLKSAGDASDAMAGETDAQTQAQDAAKESADALAKSVDGLARRTALASLEFDAAAAGASAFGDAMERAQSADNLLAAGLDVSSAMRDLRSGFFGEAEAAEEAANETDTLAGAMDSLNAALAYTDPSLTKTEIGFGRLAAAASAFRESMSRNPIRSQIGAALDLGEAYTDFSKTMRRLPGEIDLIDASMGKYRPRTMEAIRTMLQLGEASQEYLATLLESGKGQDYVRGEADRLRQAYIEQFRAAGKTEAEIAKYIETLGLTPAQVETAIKLSGVEGARFEIQSYLSLLEGRIPESVAASVTAKISAGNLEAAAAELAALAASNPVKIPVGIDDESVKAAKEELLELPQSFDFAKAALGGYTEEQERGLEAVLKLGDATKAYLQELVASGKGDQAITEAERLREEYRRQFEQFGVAGAAFDEYADKLLGLDPDDIKIGIDLASFESDVFKVNTLLGLLGEDVSDETRWKIRMAIETGDLDAAYKAANDELAAQQFYATVGLQLQTDAAVEQLFGFNGLVSTTPATQKLDFDVQPAVETLFGFGGWVKTSPAAQKRVDADMTPATGSVDAWRFGVAATTTDTQIDANTDPAVGTIFNTIAGLPEFEIRIKPVFADGAFKGLPSFGIPGAATGGLITGPGTGTSDSILTLLSNGEYVLQASAVRDIGVATLDRLNAGQVDTLNRNEVSVSVAAPPTGEGPQINYTVIEAQEHPTPADLARVVGTGMWVGGR